MKAFDLQKALAGAPVVNGAGLKVLITKLAAPMKLGVRLIAQCEKTGGIQSYNREDGTSDNDGSMFKLFMAPVEKTVYANLYRQDDGHIYVGNSVSESLELADERARYVTTGSNGTILLKTFPITYEE